METSNPSKLSIRPCHIHALCLLSGVQSTSLRREKNVGKPTQAPLSTGVKFMNKNKIFAGSDPLDPEELYSATC